ncbi:MAG: hypothetical protein CGW95_09780 [Phenylobacterium zucineum]|nr:MAG: hypothetical protein CGW95_09780 [Phenylobacterium zucineum]
MALMRQDWIGETMNASAEFDGSLIAKTPEGLAFATVRLIDKPGEDFRTVAIFLGLPVVVLFFCSFNYPIGFVGIGFLIFNVLSVARNLARIEVDGGDWGDANRSTMWRLFREELLLLVYQVLAIATTTIIIFEVGFTIAYAFQVYRIQKLASKNNLADWVQNAVAGLERNYLERAARKIEPIAEVSIIPSVTSEQLSELHDQMADDLSRLSTLEPFNTERVDLAGAWYETNVRQLEQLLDEGDRQTRKAWKESIKIFNAAKENVDTARGGVRVSVTEAEAALAAYTINEASIVIERSGTLQGAMVAAQLAPKTFIQQLRFDRGVPLAMTKFTTGNMPWQVAAAFAAGSLVMMAVNHSKLMRQLKELEGQLIEQSEAVRGDIRLIESELRLRLIPQFDGLTALLDRLRKGVLELSAAEATVGRGNAKPEAFNLACAVREANYLLEMKAGN